SARTADYRRAGARRPAERAGDPGRSGDHRPLGRNRHRATRSGPGCGAGPDLCSGAGEGVLMVKRILGSQAFMSIAGALVIVLLAVVGYVIAFDPIKETRSYCAIMPDSVGLYEGNKVSMRGIDVGTVTGIRPDGAAVRVDF